MDNIRLFFALCCGILCGACTHTTTPPSDDVLVPLQSISPFPVGVAVDVGRLLSHTPYRTVAETHFNSFTAENSMKMSALRPDASSFYWDEADTLAAFCKQLGARLHGHTLVWHNQNPDWVENFQGTPEQWAAMLKKHIQTVVARYKGTATTWDVVNEAFDDNGGLRPTIWRQHLGDDYIAQCFQWAREADPTAQLLYNDYNVEENGAKLQAVLLMLDDFQKRGIPIDGIGFQMHILDTYPPLPSIHAAVQAVQQRGVLIHFSELDVSLNFAKTATALTEGMKQRQRQRVEDIVSLYRTIPAAQQVGITLWGIADTDSWIPNFFSRLDWPLLFDEQYNPKPALYGFLDALRK